MPPELMDVSAINETVLDASGNNLTLHKTIFSRADIISYNWTKPDGTIVPGIIRKNNLTLNISNTNVKDTGYSFSLVIGQVGDDDLGVYAFNVCNTFGCGTFYTHVKDSGWF